MNMDNQVADGSGVKYGALRPVTASERRTPIRLVVNVFESSRIGVRRSGYWAGEFRPGEVRSVGSATAWSPTARRCWVLER